MTPPPADNFAARIFLGPALRAQPDRRLVDLVRDGYDAAFEEIVRRYRRPLDRFAAAIVGGRSEDVTQDAFSKALLALRREFDADIDLRPWLYRIVHNTALNHLRERAGGEAVLDERLPGGEAPHQAVERRQGLHDAVAAVRALPLRQRDAIVLRELEGRSYDEIAGELGVTRGAARQLLSRARTSMRAGVSALIPVGPLMRLAAPLADGPAAARVAELGAGGAVPKLCAVALAAGAIAGGANELPSFEREAPAARSPSTQAEGSVAASTGAVPVRTASSTSTPRAATPTAAGKGDTGSARAVAPIRVTGAERNAQRPRGGERLREEGPRDSSRRREPHRARHPAGEPRPAPWRPAPGDPRPATGTAPPPPRPGPGDDGQYSATGAPDGGGLGLPR
jgi:RNA polymerase sigma factor (sigma-70 family)